MEAMLVSTSKMVELELGPEFRGCVPARIWEGTTAGGVKFQAFIVRVAVADGEDLEQFEIELKEMTAPSAAAQVWPLRMVL